MKYAYFPGCVLEGAAKEAHLATARIAELLGVELVEIPGWSCCGASHVQDVDELTTTAINARNIALAEEMGLPIVTVCNTCTFMLRKAKRALDDGMSDQVRPILAKAGLEYKGTSEVTHLLWMLIRDYGLDNLRKKVIRPLTGVKVAGYYGCHLLRPPRIMDFEDHAKPQALDDLIRVLGAEPVDFDAKLDCCGFHAVFTAEKSVHTMTGKTALSASQAGADCMVTPCPLCQMQLDMYQPEGRKAIGSTSEMPVLHLSQLIGLALGLTPQEMKLASHVTSVAVSWPAVR